MKYASLRKAALTFLLFLEVFSLCAFTRVQSALQRTQSESQKEREEKADSKQASEVDLIRWRSMLDQLSDQARSLSEEKSRALLVAEIADAYWTLDKDRSSELFVLAFEAAVGIKDNSKDSSTAVSRVLSLAAKRSSSLAKKLTDQLTLESAKNPRIGSSSIQAAFDLLKSNPEAASQLAEAGAPLGLSTDAAGIFILQLARHDVRAAEKVYRAYLNKLSSRPRVPIGSLLWLGGFPFGYAESYSFTSYKMRIAGTGGQQIPELAPNPALARAFLDLALISIRNTLEASLSAPPPTKDSINGIALFVATYLLSEVERHRPEAATQWQLLYRQALAATPPALQQEVNNQIQLVLSNRAIAEKKSQPESYESSEPGLDALERSAKLPEGCERDRAYAEAALKFGVAKDYARAFATAEKVKETSTRKEVLQFLTYELASVAIGKGDLDEAQRQARRIDSPEQRTLLYVKIAGVALSQKDRVLAALLLAEMRQKSSSIADESARAAVLIAAAAVYSEFDPLIAFQTVKDAIKAINQSGSSSVDTFSVLRKVNLACPGDAYERWIGGGDKAERFSLLETVAELSKTDVIGCIAIAESIEDRPTRIRALVAIARTAIGR